MRQDVNLHEAFVFTVSQEGSTDSSAVYDSDVCAFHFNVITNKIMLF